MSTASKYSLGIDVIVLEEAIGTLDGGARPAGLRDGRGGLLNEGGGDHKQAIGPTIITEFGVAEFVDSPMGDRSWRWTKRGCMGIKHLAIKYITC